MSLIKVVIVKHWQNSPGKFRMFSYLFFLKAVKSTEERSIRGDILRTVRFNLTSMFLVILAVRSRTHNSTSRKFLPVFPAYILDNDEVVQDGSYAPAPTTHDWYLLIPPPQPSAMVFVPSFWQPSCYRINNLQKKERFVTIRNFASFPDVFQN